MDGDGKTEMSKEGNVAKLCDQRKPSRRSVTNFNFVPPMTVPTEKEREKNNLEIVLGQDRSTVYAVLYSIGDR